jgi:hypothetical protein
MWNRKVEAEEQLMLHMRAMGGWVGARLTPDERLVMERLVFDGRARRLGSGVQDRYELTVVGAQIAERLAAR